MGAIAEGQLLNYPAILQTAEGTMIGQREGTPPMGASGSKVDRSWLALLRFSEKAAFYPFFERESYPFSIFFLRDADVEMRI